MTQEIFRERDRSIESSLECFAAFFADERIGVVPIGQEQKANLTTITHLAQRIFQRAPSGGATGTIAVEAEDQLVADSEDARQMFGRRRRAERRDGIGDPGLV